MSAYELRKMAVFLVCLGILVFNSMAYSAENRSRLERGVSIKYLIVGIETNASNSGVGSSTNSRESLLSIGGSHRLREDFALVGIIFVNPINPESCAGVCAIQNYDGVVTISIKSRNWLSPTYK